MAETTAGHQSVSTFEGEVNPHNSKLYVPNDSGEGWTTHEFPSSPDSSESLELPSSSERTDVHEQVLESIVKGQEQQLEDVDSLKARLAEQDSTIASLQAQMKEMRAQLDSLKATAVAEAEAPVDVAPEKKLAETQPRRVRNLDPSNPDSPTERLVKYEDGTYDWVPTAKAVEAPVEGEKSADEASPAEAEPTAEPVEGASEEAVPSAETNPADNDNADKAEGDEKGEQQPVATPEESAEPQEADATSEETPEKTEGDSEAHEDDYDAENAQRKFDAHMHEDEQPVEGREAEEKEAGKELVVHQGVEISPELRTLLQESIDRYAEETAKSRNGYVGQFLRTSKFLVKIPGVRALAEKVNDFVDRDLDSARKVYEQSVHSAQKEIEAELKRRNKEDPELSREQLVQAIQYNAGLLAVDTDKAFEEKVVAERTARSKPTTKIVNWWVSHQGIKSKLVKFAGVATVGVTAGGLATTLGVIGGFGFPGLGAVAGAAAGAYIGNYINKRRANAVDAEGVTLAQRQSNEDVSKKEQVFTDAMDRRTMAKNPNYDPNNPDSGPEYVPNRAAMVRSTDLTSVTEGRTAEEMRGNRRRMAQAKAAGGLGGGLGEILTNGILNNIGSNGGDVAHARSGELTPDNGANNGVTPDATPSGAESGAPTPEQFNGLDFNVEAGNGYTNELMDFASANGHALSPQQAWDLHNNLVQQFGGDYLDIANQAKDVYQSAGGDFRLTAPGQASWDPGVAEAIKTWMTGKGLW